MVNYPTEETMTAIRKKVSNKIKMGIAPIFFLLLAVFCLGAFCNFAYAADLVWDGGGVDDNFSTAANWVGDAAPAINDNVTFNAGAVNCVLDAFDLGTGDFIVTSGYSGTFSSSGTFKCDVCTLNLTNAAWSITNQFETGTTDHGAWTITAGTFTTSAALYVSGNIIIGVGGAINQTGQWTVMRGAATKTISNLGGAAENDITFYKFEENSDTNGGAVAKTQIQCNIAVGAEGMFTNGWNQATDGYFVIGDGTNAIVVTVSGGYYNKGKSETLANSKVSVAGDIEFNDGNCWGFDTSAGGTFEWTGAAGRHVWPNSNTAYSFYDFILSGSNTLNHQVNDIYITNNFTITDGILYMTKSMYVTGNIALSGDAILRPLGDDNPGQVRFGGTLSCAGTSKVATELAGTGAAPNNYVEIIGSAGALRAFTGVTASLDQSWLEDGINEIRFNNVDVQFDLTSQGTGEKLALTGDSTFDAITLNGSAATSFTTGAYTATLGGAFINTFGAVTISASGAINIGANAFMSNTANSIVATSGALTCGDLTIAGTFTNTAANTIFSTGNVEISVFGATAANNTLTMDCTATLDTKTLNASVPLGNFTVNSSGTIQLLTSALDVDGNFRLQAGTLDCNSLGQNYAGDYQRDAGTTYTSTGTTTTFDGTAAQTATSNSLTYNTITITNSHADGVIFADAFTTATLNDTTASSKLTFNAGDTYTITGAAGLNLDGGAAGTEITLISDLAGTKFTFDVTGGDQTVTYVNVKDSAASGNDITANTSINSGGNDDAGATPQWVFGNVARYWIAAGNSDWDTNANWSSASGGTGPADYPDAGDTAIFDNNVASNCTLDAPATIAALDVQAYAGIISCGTNNFTTSANMTVTSGAFTVGANTTQVGGALKVDGGTGTFTSGALDCNGALDIQGGALTAPDGTGGNFNVAANWSHSGGTFNHSSGTVIFDTAAASTIADNTTFYNLTCTQAGKQINFTNGTTQTANNTLTLTGTSGNLITLRSTAAGSKWDITLPNGAQTVSFIDVKDADANTNTITCYTSTDSGNNNTNWVFKSLSTTTPEAGKTVGQQPTIRGSAGAGDTVTIKGTVGTVAYQTVAQVTADANGNYIVRQANYSATLDAGANNIRADVGVTLGAPVNVTVVAAPTINQVPTISSPVDGGKVSSEKPALSGSGLAGQNVTVSAWD
ncbi:MAG: hypothetical protein KAU12_00160, partial [Candidatus Omnitrophica bacterium]|nr:hypothetical protein [Candidatus Omnitrophota bacterium]